MILRFLAGRSGAYLFLAVVLAAVLAAGGARYFQLQLRAVSAELSAKEQLLDSARGEIESLRKSLAATQEAAHRANEIARSAEERRIALSRLYESARADGERLRDIVSRYAHESDAAVAACSGQPHGGAAAIAELHAEADRFAEEAAREADKWAAVVAGLREYAELIRSIDRQMRELGE